MLLIRCCPFVKPAVPLPVLLHLGPCLRLRWAYALGP